MKILISDLRRIIKEELLKEAAISANQAVNDGVAMYSRGNNAYMTYVLYRATGHRNSVMESILNENMAVNDFASLSSWATLAAIQVSLGSANDPSYIENVLSKESGYGPLLHDIAIKYHSPIKISLGGGEQNVSDAEKKLLMRYLEKDEKGNKLRKDIKSSKHFEIDQKTGKKINNQNDLFLLTPNKSFSVDDVGLIANHKNIERKIFTNPRIIKENNRVIYPIDTYDTSTHEKKKQDWEFFVRGMADVSARRRCEEDMATWKGSFENELYRNALAMLQTLHM